MSSWTSGDMIPVALERLLWPLCGGWGRDGLSKAIASTRAAVATQGQVVKLHPLWYLWTAYPPVSHESIPRETSARSHFTDTYNAA